MDRIKTRWLAAGTLAVFAASAIGVGAAEMGMKGKGMRQKGEPRKIEKFACKLGSEDRHARIAIQVVNGRVEEFAYYSIWKPRTCSLHVQKGDAYSKWEEFKGVTTITLIEDTGAVLIDHERDHYKFIFREIDRMRYCGTEGKVTGSLTIWRGKDQCELDAVMDDDPSKPRAVEAPQAKEPPAAAAQKPAAGKGP